MVVLDADLAIQMPLTKIIETIGEADIGLFYRRPSRAPWLDISANVLVVRSTEATHNYLRLVRNYINFFMEHDDPQWHLDQTALYCTLRMMQKQGIAPNVSSISGVLNEGVFLLGHKYDERMSDPCYARFNT